jgi:hypothetical protein
VIAVGRVPADMGSRKFCGNVPQAAIERRPTMTATMLRERFARFGVGLRARIVDFLD